MKSLILLLIILFSSVCYGNEPFLNNGNKWRIGYYEGGQYNDYQIIFIQTLKELSNRGWMEPFIYEYITDYRKNYHMWKWLIQNVKSDYIEFVDDAFYSSDFYYPLRKINRYKINNRNDLDLIFAMGTWAGLDLQQQKYKIPTLVLSTSNPVQSGIIHSPHNSGYEHLHAKVETNRYKQQIKLFDNIVNINVLGFVYEDTMEGKTFAAYNDIMSIADVNGFFVETCIAQNNNVSLEEAERQVIECYKELAPKVDSFYITSHRGENINNIKNLIEILNEYDVRSFAMVGDDYVKNGALISISHGNFSYVSVFHADTVIKVFNGIKPIDIPQEWTAPDKISINLTTANKIGFKFDFMILSNADKIFR